MNHPAFNLSCVPVIGPLAHIRTMLKSGDRVRVNSNPTDLDTPLYWGVLRQPRMTRQPARAKDMFWMDVEPNQLNTRAAFPKSHVDAVDLTRSTSAVSAVVEWLGLVSSSDKKLLETLHNIYY